MTNNKIAPLFKNIFPSLLFRINSFIKKTNLDLLIISPMIISFLVMSIPGIMFGINQKPLTEVTLKIYFFPAAFFMGLPGLFKAIRKESPGYFGKYMKGIPSLITGLVEMIFFWLFGLIILLW